jgi:hypothetical protein
MNCGIIKAVYFCVISYLENRWTDFVNCFNWYSGGEGGGVQLSLLGTAAINGLLCQPRVILMMKKLVE